MATGASKAKREYAKQEAQAYYKALNELEKATPVKRIDTQSARKLSDAMEGEVSYGTKRLAMKADKVGRQINADTTLNPKIEAFNKRFDEMKRQMNGETIKKYSPPKEQNAGGGMLSFAMQNLTGGQSAIGKYDTAEEALANTPAPKKNANPIFGMNQQQSESFSPIGMAINKQAPSAQVTELGRIDAGHRQLAATKGAYKDLEQLSKGISENAAAKMTKEYEAIGNQLKAKLKREQPIIGAGGPNGLLNSELASAAPKQEVIQ